MENTKRKIINICKSLLVAAQNLSQTKNSDRNKALRLIAKNFKKYRCYSNQNRKDIKCCKKK